jgi:type I restriction enzyme R subunit
MLVHPFKNNALFNVRTHFDGPLCDVLEKRRDPDFLLHKDRSAVERGQARHGHAPAAVHDGHESDAFVEPLEDVAGEAFERALVLREVARQVFGGADQVADPGAECPLLGGSLSAAHEYLPPEESAVVFSAGHNDEPELSQFHLDEAAEKRLRQSFVRSDKLPKILIVTEKLLTGFDAPVLYCLYLDKPMRDHTLLQAIARVNRPYEDARGVQKPCGFVVDFVGIFANLEKALSFDSDEVASVIQNVDVLRQTFERLMKMTAAPYLELTRGAPDDKLVEKAVEFFTDGARRDAFNRFFAEIRNLHDILSPDAFLRPYLGEYVALTRLSGLIRQAFGPQTGLIRDLTKETENIVREGISAYGFSGTLPLVRIDEEALAALKRDHESKSVTRVINLGRSLTTTIAAEAAQQPYLIPLGDRAESILEGLTDRREATGAALEELEKLIREYLDVQTERRSLGLSAGSFALYQALKLSDVEEKKRKPLAEKLDGVFLRFPEFRESAAQLRALKADLYKELMPAVGRDRMVKIADALMKARG